MDIQEIVALSVKHNVSDLHLCSSGAVRWRRQGRLEPAPVSAPDLEMLLRQWLAEEAFSQWQRENHCDFAVQTDTGLRLRVSAFRHSAGVSLVLRLLPETCPQLAELGTPPALAELLNEESGLILVTGSTGSGKSTTLAAMVDTLNQTHDGHILTLEDPVEFVHGSERCLIHQREVGTHCASFSSALRVALRQDPDVILLGELRDKETISLALTAAETGHLVLATLHTRGAAQAVERLVDVFPAGEKDQVRSQLAGSLCAVLAQKLLPDRQGGRVALYELLINTPAVGSLIREGKTHQLAGVMQTGQQSGMLTFSQSYQQRLAAGRV
ncbi:type IV pilus twitching motility protein PilT [Enterobacteriaceae bacterium 89]|nr:type IV pilus twitching motility protein PilT [Enterobacteriaceae bacterium 89]